MRIVLATHNPGKRLEWLELLQGLPLQLLLPEEVGVSAEVEENGATYHENARLKARALVERTGLPALADDSGLEVDALDGAPGIHSARYVLGSDAVRYRALLAALAGVPPAKRTARFRCVAVLALPDGREWEVEGVVEGVITEQPQGESGFGYDPVFYVPALGKTFAQLDAATKNRLSHRGRAAQALRPILEQLIAM